MRPRNRAGWIGKSRRKATRPGAHQLLPRPPLNRALVSTIAAETPDLDQRAVCIV